MTGTDNFIRPFFLKVKMLLLKLFKYPCSKLNCSMRKYRLLFILVICVLGVAAIGIGLLKQSVKQVSTENSESWEELTVKTVEAMKGAKPEEAEKFCKQAMKMLKEAGKEDIRLVKTYMLMGEVYRWESKYAQAEEFYKQAIVLCEKVAGKDHPDMLIPLESLANFYYYTLVDYNKVASLYERILNIVTGIHDYDNNQLAIRTRNLADVYCLSGRYSEAEPLYRQALALIEKVPAPDQSDHVQYLLSQAEFYRQWKKCDQAELPAKRALAIRQAIREKKSGPDSQLDVAVCLDALGKIYLDCNRSGEAALVYEQSLKIIEKLGGINSPDLAPRLTGLGTAFRQQHKYIQAEAHYLRALKILESNLGKNSSEIIPVLEQYAVLMREVNKPEKAKALLVRADSIR
jgi:tetratricopeptide (TPR) repeat protein